MDFEFRTQEELYERVKPALHAKIEELKRLNYPNITELDIWYYLTETNGKNLKI